MTGLRDIESLSLHPDAAKVPLPDGSDLRALRDSLRENGQQDPVDVTPDGVILDGRTRWQLMKELGCRSIQVREIEMPDHQQTNYIIERALARRHLTPQQKRALNDLLRVQVVEVRLPSATSIQRGVGPMRIGLSQTERAAKLGVDRDTVKRWDTEPLVGVNTPTSDLPTHAVDGRGRPQPLHKSGGFAPRGHTPRAVKPEVPRPEPLRKARAIPAWSRHVSTWLRHSARPEDRDYLRRLDREIHAALRQNGIECQEGKTA